MTGAFRVCRLFLPLYQSRRFLGASDFDLTFDLAGIEHHDFPIGLWVK